MKYIGPESLSSTACIRASSLLGTLPSHESDGMANSIDPHDDLLVDYLSDGQIVMVSK